MATHFSHAALPYPIRRARFTIAVPYLDADGDPTDPTTPDTEVSKDGGAFADCTEEVTTISGSNGAGYITLTGEELTGSLVVVAAKVASGPKATLMTLHPRPLPTIAQGTLSAGSASGGTLGTILPYDITGCFIRTTGGTGGGGSGERNNQARRIEAYDTSTGVFTAAINFETALDNTTTYDILLPDGVTVQMIKALNPTTAGRTLDVSAGGEAGVDWANVGSPTTTVGLSGTTVKTATDVETDTADIQGRIPAALVSGRIDVSVGAMAANVMTAAAAAADLTTELQSGLATSANQATIMAYLDTEIAAILAAVDTEVAAIKAVTDKLDDTLEDDAGTYRFTTNALEQAPTGGGGGGISLLASGTASAGGASTLSTGVAVAANLYRYATLNTVGGTGAGQSRKIASNDAAGILTVNEPWITVPDNTTDYEIVGNGEASATVDDIVGGVWNALRVDYAVVGSFGEMVIANMIQVAGNSTAADTLNEAFNGTGFTATGWVVPWNPLWSDETILADVQSVNSIELTGSGTDEDPWRALGT